MNNEAIKGTPFLKWLGSKRQLSSTIVAEMPKGKRLIEPFIGSGAIFMASDYKEYILADINPDLINLYEIIRDDCDRFIGDASKLFNDESSTKDVYYQLRDEFNTSDDQFRKACLFLYLNKFGFNGVCRYNRSGKFNVPIGTIGKKTQIPEKQIRLFSKKLNTCKVTLRCSSFEDTMRLSKKGDVIYCDPPYYPLSPSQNFVHYHTDGFGLAEQESLASIATELSCKGVHLLLSNSKTSEGLYADASSIHQVSVNRFVGGKEAKRGSVKEIIAVYAAKSEVVMSIKEQIIKVLDSSEKALSANEIYKLLPDVNKGSLQGVISTMNKSGELTHEKKSYSLTQENNETNADIEDLDVPDEPTLDVPPDDAGSDDDVNEEGDISVPVDISIFIGDKYSEVKASFLNDYIAELKQDMIKLMTDTEKNKKAKGWHKGDYHEVVQQVIDTQETIDYVVSYMDL